MFFRKNEYFIQQAADFDRKHSLYLSSTYHKCIAILSINYNRHAPSKAGLHSYWHQPAEGLKYLFLYISVVNSEDAHVSSSQ